jgi:hypothetical protein
MSYKSRNTEKDMKDLIKKPSKTWHIPRFFFFLSGAQTAAVFFFIRESTSLGRFSSLGLGWIPVPLGFSHGGLGWRMNVYLVGLRQCSLGLLDAIESGSDPA